MFSSLTLSLLVILGVAPEAWGGCPSTATDLRDSVNAANAAFANMDEPFFKATMEEIRLLIPCLSEPVTPVDAAALHRVEAFDAFLRQDGERTLRAFRASLALQPAFTLPDTVAPEGTPLAQQYDSARSLPDAGFVALKGPVGTLLLVDGSLAWSLPTSRPALVQLMNMDGRIRWSGYVWPGSPLPPGLERSTSEEDSALLVQPVVTRPGPSRFLLYGALSGGVAAGVLMAWSWSFHASWTEKMSICNYGGCMGDPEGSAAELDRLRNQTNATAIASGATALVSIGLGVAAAVTFQW